RDWYLSHFPLKLNLKVKRAITGEATTFMYPFHVPRLVHEMMPEVKIVFLLRDPIDRAFSHYKHNLRRSGRETLSFGQAIRQEHIRISAALERSMADEWYNDEDNRMYSYIARGLYARQIKRWREFFSSEQMLILESEKFYEDPQSILDCVTDFLGLERHKFNTSKQYNVGGYADGILEADRRYLEDIFADENNALFTLIGKNFWQKK
ncbi:MAG: sulfotransferase domain-containing protein, partial [Cyanobacteria bacterium J06636_16]